MPLSASAREGLLHYVSGPLRVQLRTELDSNMPSDVTFVFGHTHKPFQKDLDFDRYPRWVNVYNTGGWVVDTMQAQRLHGGAVVLVDEALNTASLRMYNEAEDAGGTPSRCRRRSTRASRRGCSISGCGSWWRAIRRRGRRSPPPRPRRWPSGRRTSRSGSCELREPLAELMDG